MSHLFSPKRLAKAPPRGGGDEPHQGVAPVDDVGEALADPLGVNHVDGEERSYHRSPDRPYPHEDEEKEETIRQHASDIGFFRLTLLRRGIYLEIFGWLGFDTENGDGS